MISSEERDNILEELRQEYPIVEQVKFNEFNIGDKLQENMKLRIKYQELYEKELFIYNQLLEKYNDLVGKRYDFWRFESDRKLGKNEIEQYYLPRDSKIVKIKKVLEKQDIRVKFFKLCMDSIEKLYWRIKEWNQNERI